jgi:catechol-2,3-dioxygenase
VKPAPAFWARDATEVETAISGDTIGQVSRVIGIDHCVIAVSDWNRSNAFYRDILGADLVERGNGVRVSVR